MSISTYAELKTAVANWLEDDNLTDRIPEFIALAEFDASNTLRVRLMESRDTSITTVAGTEFYTLPTTFLEARFVQFNRNPVRRMKYRTPEQYITEKASTTTGDSQVFTIIGSEIGFRPIPSAAWTVEISMYSRLAPLSDSNTTNWFTDNAPQILLYGALYHASIYLVDNERVAAFHTVFNQMIGKWNDSEQSGRFSGSHKSMRTATGNP